MSKHSLTHSLTHSLLLLLHPISNNNLAGRSARTAWKWKIGSSWKIYDHVELVPDHRGSLRPGAIVLFFIGIFAFLLFLTGGKL